MGSVTFARALGPLLEMRALRISHNASFASNLPARLARFKISSSSARLLRNIASPS